MFRDLRDLLIVKNGGIVRSNRDTMQIQWGYDGDQIYDFDHDLTTTSPQMMVSGKGL